MAGLHQEEEEARGAGGGEGVAEGARAPGAHEGSTRRQRGEGGRAVVIASCLSRGAAAATA